MIDDPITTITLMKQISNLGVHFAIDGYGTGFSSPSYLHKIPANCLKIDRSLLVKMIQNEQNAVIIRAAIDMAAYISAPRSPKGRLYL